MRYFRQVSAPTGLPIRDMFGSVSENATRWEFDDTISVQPFHRQNDLLSIQAQYRRHQLRGWPCLHLVVFPTGIAVKSDDRRKTLYSVQLYSISFSWLALRTCCCAHG